MSELLDDAFGLCPFCHKQDGFANAGKSHRFFCKEHRVSWPVGSNLFSSWRDETEEEQRRIWDEIGLNDFTEVKPYHYPRPAEEPQPPRPSKPRHWVEDDTIPF